MNLDQIEGVIILKIHLYLLGSDNISIPHRKYEFINASMIFEPLYEFNNIGNTVIIHHEIEIFSIILKLTSIFESGEILELFKAYFDVYKSNRHIYFPNSNS